MAVCTTCNKWILFGGQQVGGRRYCSKPCQATGEINRAADAVPDDEARTLARTIHSGPCPRCRGPGPNDIHTSHQVWSLVLVTRWKSTSRVSCRRCGIRSQAADGLISLVAGWWGFPWGLLVTPMQLARTVHAMAVPADRRHPSPRLHRHARLLLARHEGGEISRA